MGERDKPGTTGARRVAKWMPWWCLAGRGSLNGHGSLCDPEGSLIEEDSFVGPWGSTISRAIYHNCIVVEHCRGGKFDRTKVYETAFLLPF